MQLINGTSIADQIISNISDVIQKLKGRKPGLAFIRVGENPASLSYIKMKKRKCAEVGILSIDREFPASISENILLKEIHLLNKNDEVDGILVQLPLPSHISTFKILEAVSPEKDVDGFNPINMGHLLLGENEFFYPCTPHGILVMLTQSDIELEGKHVVILGRSNIVGKPLAAMLMQKKPHCNATVTIAHSKSQNIISICRSADVLIAAIGSPQFVKENMINQGAVVIDVGINRINDPHRGPIIVGDVHFETVAPKSSFITPVPGGVGPMTIAMLLSNTLLSYQRKNP